MWLFGAIGRGKTSVLRAFGLDIPDIDHVVIEWRLEVFEVGSHGWKGSTSGGEGEWEELNVEESVPNEVWVVGDGGWETENVGLVNIWEEDCMIGESETL